METKTIKVMHNLQTFARINNKTKEIEVCPRYNLLSDEMKHYVVLQLEFMTRTGTPIESADKQALEAVMKLYPKHKKGYWIKEIANVLYNERPNELSLSRIEKLSSSSVGKSSKY